MRLGKRKVNVGGFWEGHQHFRTVLSWRQFKKLVKSLKKGDKMQFEVVI